MNDACPKCQSTELNLFKRPLRLGYQRFRCKKCRCTFNNLKLSSAIRKKLGKLTKRFLIDSFIAKGSSLKVCKQYELILDLFISMLGESREHEKVKEAYEMVSKVGVVSA